MSSQKVEVGSKKLWVKDMGSNGMEIHDVTHHDKMPRKVLFTSDKKVSHTKLKQVLAGLA